MKKLVAFLLCILLCFGAAAAETTVTSKTLEMERGNLELNPKADTMIQSDKVVDQELNPLSEEYYSVYVNSSTGMYTVSMRDGREGILDKQGSILVPAEYDDTEIISERWFAGIRLKEATAENYDYKSWSSTDPKFYLIDTVDIYYLSECKATLDRMEYQSATAYGNYLCIRNRENKYTFYNKDFEMSSVHPDYSQEYTEDYKTGTVIHNGSGQEAFVPGCTLTPDDVKQFVWVNQKKDLVDLQGNVIADLFGYSYSSVEASTNYIRVTGKDGKGLMDSDGTLVVPCEYDSIGYSLETSRRTGYTTAVKDGKIGFVSLKDGSESGFLYLESAGSVRGMFIQVDDPREGTILISPAGELPSRYQEVSLSYNGAPYAVVKDMDDHIHVIGLMGEDILPDNPEISSLYSVSLSDDGTRILVRIEYGVYRLYTVDYDPDFSALTPAAADPSVWICPNCGTENGGKFCSECGSPRPEAAAPETETEPAAEPQDEPEEEADAA